MPQRKPTEGLRQLAAIAAGAAALIAVASAQESTAPTVRAEFEELCRSLAQGDSEFYGNGRARVLEERLEETTTDPIEALRLRGALAVRYLELGELDRSIALLEEVLAQAPSAGFTEQQTAAVHWNLGIARLLAAEDLNCVEGHDATSCIFPFTPQALHHDPELAAKAGDAFLDYLEIDPGRVEAAWLANLSRILSKNFPEGVPEAYRLPVETLRIDHEAAAWVDVAPALGVNSFDLAGGAVMDDFDGDGLLDLVSSTWDPCGSARAFRNDGKGGFEDVTAAWGLDEQLGGLNLVHADYDGDGRLDLLVLRGAWLHEGGRMRNSLLHNEPRDGGLRFVDVTRVAGLAEPAYPTQTAAWADYDLDGDLDLYVGNEMMSREVSAPSQLFRNDGDGTFTDVTVAAGVTHGIPAKGVAWGDYDNDGDPDLYVSSLGSNRLYRNQGDGAFVDVALESGVRGERRRTFATWFFDYDNDADLDLFVADYESQPAAVLASYFGPSLSKGQPEETGQPRLYRNDGGSFTDVSRQLGMARPTLPMGAGYGDLDNDGWLDFYLGTGTPNYASVMPNVMYRNEAGKRWSEVVAPGGFGHLQKGHGVAFGDLDNDGDQDLFHQLGGFFGGDAYFNALFENPGSNGSWITLRLRGGGRNPFAVGARVEVRVEGPSGERSIHLLVGASGSFGGSSMQQEVGLGDAERLLEVVIRWPSGTESRFGSVPLRGVYLAVEGGDVLEAIDLPALSLGSP